MEEIKKRVGRVTHYYTKISVCIVELEDELRVGDEISIEGTTTNFRQTVESMEIEHRKVEVAKAGDSVGIKVKERAREGDIVYKILK